MSENDSTKPKTIRLRRQYPEYGTWMRMRNRCTNKKSDNYAYYGGKGIKVCERWNDFFAFLEDMGPRPTSSHSIDRIDSNGNYEPGNCRWATIEEQNRNRCSNLFFTLNGVTRQTHEWSAITGLSMKVIYLRRGKGWSDEKILTTKKRRFDEAAVREIRRLRSSGVMTKQIAERFDCDRATIQRIVNRKAFSDVE